MEDLCSFSPITHLYYKKKERKLEQILLNCQSRKRGISETSKIFQTNQVKLVSKQGGLNIFPFIITPNEDAGPALPCMRLSSHCGSGCHFVGPAQFFDVE